jgi:hypothetical protein
MMTFKSMWENSLTPSGKTSPCPDVHRAPYQALLPSLSLFSINSSFNEAAVDRWKLSELRANNKYTQHLAHTWLKTVYGRCPELWHPVGTCSATHW